MHTLPHTVFYTARTDPVLRSLTEGSARWPDDYTFRFFNDTMLEESVVRLSRMLADQGVPNLYRA